MLGSVSAAYVNALLDTAVNQGAERRLLLQRAAIPAEHLADPGWRLDIAGLLRLFDLARELSGDDCIGLHMGMQVRPRTFSALGYAAMSCGNLGEAVALIPRYESLVYDGGSTRITVEGRQVRLAWRSGSNELARMRPVNEAIVAGWLSFGRWISGIRGELSGACFQHPRPATLQPHERFFDCPLRFDAPDNALSFDLGLFATPLIQHDEQLRGLMEQQARERLREIRGADLPTRVAAAIRQRLPHGNPSSADIARLLNLSDRTLRRHLEAGGVSFADLLATQRRELALQYLADPGLGLADIAMLLGYSGQSSFTAAFKSWTGLPPGEYRQQQRP
ncbi:MAG TPA: AraC family transcriptional regulator [Solimonas sp.]|nr:AraC family transcriptional regulator [Solimonas sp.]